MDKETVYVIKVGGNVIDDSKKLSSFLNSFANLKARKILVHGGGKVATKLADSLGQQTQMIEGRRVTDSAMLDVVTMTYGGTINKKISSLLQSLGVSSVGMAGFEGSLLQAIKRPPVNGVDYGFVGDVQSVKSEILTLLIENGYVPVVAPLTSDENGQILNTNADTIASQLAVGLSEKYEVILTYVFELPGLLADINDHNSLIKKIDSTSYHELKLNGSIQGGMIPKLDNAFSAIKSGVNKVSIIHFEQVGQIHKPDFHDYTQIS